MMPLLENVVENKKFLCFTKINLWSHLATRERSASTYPCRSSESVQENGVEGVVLVVIQITGDPSAEWMAPPRSTHVQPGDVSHALIQQGERERSRTHMCWAAQTSGIYRGRGGAAPPPRVPSLGVAAAPRSHLGGGQGGGGEGKLAPQVRWRRPLPKP